LIKAGSKGLPAGEIARQLKVKQNTMLANLSKLAQAGVIYNVREGRVIRYFVNRNAVAALMQFMLHDCCDGHPDLCRYIIEPTKDNS
jgi:ArsR family transcriptional regulator, arsenate/arsenite/antimonite-responsive transcriptional repressor